MTRDEYLDWKEEQGIGGLGQARDNPQLRQTLIDSLVVHVAKEQLLGTTHKGHDNWASFALDILQS